MAHDWIAVRGARVHNLKNIDVDIPRAQARRHHRPVGLGQVVARLRHDLRRRAAALRRVAVGVRPAVPRADGEAGRRSDRRAVAGDLDRAEDHRLESALDRRHGHRNLRLPAPAVRQHRRAALPELRQGDRQPVARAHRRHGDAVSAGRAHQRAGADRPRPQGRVQEGARGAARARLHQGAHRRPVPLARRGHQARSAPQSHHRGRRRSADRARRRRAAADRVGRRRAQPRRRHRRHQHVRRRRSAVLAAAGLRRLRPQHAGDDAARVLVQLAARRLPRVPGARRDVRLRSAPRRAGRDASRWPTARSRRGRRATGSWCSEALQALSARLRHRSRRCRSASCRGSSATCCSSARRAKARREDEAEGEPDPFGAASKACCRTCGAATRRAAGRSRKSSSRTARCGRARPATGDAAEAAEPAPSASRGARSPTTSTCRSRKRVDVFDGARADRSRGDHRRAHPARRSGSACAS